MKDLRINGPIPYKPQYSGWGVCNGEQIGEILTEAQAYKLLGEALEHYELFGKSITSLKTILGVK